MDNEAFDLKTIRKSLIPPISRLEMARRMGVSNAYLNALENGLSKWPQKRRDQVDEIIAAYRIDPERRGRKKRKDSGKSHRRFKLKGGRKPRVWTPKANVADQVPVVAHSHHEIVGIG